MSQAKSCAEVAACKIQAQPSCPLVPAVNAIGSRKAPLDAVEDGTDMQPKLCQCPQEQLETHCPR